MKKPSQLRFGIAGRGRAVRCCTLFCGLALEIWGAAQVQPQRPAEAPTQYQVEAAFLLNFTKFIEWPSTAFEEPSSPFAICVMGDDPFGDLLDQLVEGEFAGGRRLVVRRLRRAPPMKACQVLYVSGADKNLGPIFADLGFGVLTVGDRASFLQDGGIIAFVIDRGHVRFDINQRAALKASLTISARLLSVARSVQR